MLKKKKEEIERILLPILPPKRWTPAKKAKGGRNGDKEVNLGSRDHGATGREREPAS